MRTILRSFFITLFSLWATTRIVDGFRIENSIQGLLIASSALLIANVFVKPIVKILFLPLNIATLGLFTIVINALILYGLDYMLVEVVVGKWNFGGISYGGYTIPGITFGIIPTYLVSASIISGITSFLRWL